MVTISIGALLLLAGYLAKRWNESNTELVALRAQVQALKKRLALRG